MVGKEYDERHPLNVYGQTKYEGELAVQTLNRYFIVRIAWVSVSYTHLSGINETGYNFANIVNKENLMPDIFNQIGDYFNKLPYGNYTLLAPASFKIGSYYTCLLYTSNKRKTSSSE